MRRMTRRQFMATLGAGAVMWAVGGCGNDENPLTGEVIGGDLPTPDEPPNPFDALVTTAQRADYDTASLRRVLTDMVDRLGGFGDLVSAGDTVGIKLNLTGGSGNADGVFGRYGETASELFWTHPEVLRVVGEMFKDAGAGRILVMEAVYDDGSYYNYGYSDVAASFGGEFVDLNKPAPATEFVEREVPDPLGAYDSYSMNRALAEVDVFVSLPKAKRHASAGVTHAMKNQACRRSRSWTSPPEPVASHV